MSNFNECDFGAITPELVLKSLLSGIIAFPACGIRTVKSSTQGKTLSSPHNCTTATDLWVLFTRALMIADDGKVAIRTTYTDAIAGAGLGTCGDCDTAFQMEEIAQAIFIEDEDGKVYLNIINITT